MDIKAHYQALYDAARTALDERGYDDIPLLHVYSGDSQTGQPHDPPLLIYRQDVERPLGTMGFGSAKVLRSSWVFTAYTADLSTSLNLLSTIAGYFESNDPDPTSDGYYTTNISVEGIQSLFEQQDGFYAVHLRVEWERSA